MGSYVRNTSRRVLGILVFFFLGSLCSADVTLVRSGLVPVGPVLVGLVPHYLHYFIISFCTFHNRSHQLDDHLENQVSTKRAIPPVSSRSSPTFRRTPEMTLRSAGIFHPTALRNELKDGFQPYPSDHPRTVTNKTKSGPKVSKNLSKRQPTLIGYHQVH